MEGFAQEMHGRKQSFNMGLSVVLRSEDLLMSLIGLSLNGL
jgi:hypothetical protein